MLCIHILQFHFLHLTLVYNLILFWYLFWDWSKLIADTWVLVCRNRIIQTKIRTQISSIVSIKSIIKVLRLLLNSYIFKTLKLIKLIFRLYSIAHWSGIKQLIHYLISQIHPISSCILIKLNIIQNVLIIKVFFSTLTSYDRLITLFQLLEVIVRVLLLYLILVCFEAGCNENCSFSLKDYIITILEY